MFQKYLLKLAFRTSLFFFVLASYFQERTALESMLLEDFHGLSPLVVLWLILMGEMLIQVWPKSRISMGCLKQFSGRYRPPQTFDRLQMFESIQKMNHSALKVLLVWLIFNSFFGLSYIRGWIGIPELLLLTMFYYVSDLICVLFFCPFQSWIMNNRCCVDCRIFNWGHFMMYTPMLFIPSFFSWSLFFMSLLILLRWELVYFKHPERFWSGSNESLRCSQCQDYLCRIKKPGASTEQHS